MYNIYNGGITINNLQVIDFNNSIDNAIFDFCYELALRDATIQGAFLGKLDELRNNEEMKYKVNDFICHILCNDSDDFVINTIDDICDLMKEYNNSKTERQYQFKLGNVQKLVNMTAKYMFISTCNNPDLRESFKNCHCPLDSTIAKLIYVLCLDSGISLNKIGYYDSVMNKRRSIKSFFKDFHFSNINKEQYIFCQESIKKIVKENSNVNSSLEFDMFYWNKYSREEIDERFKNS